MLLWQRESLLQDGGTAYPPSSRDHRLPILLDLSLQLVHQQINRSVHVGRGFTPSNNRTLGVDGGLRNLILRDTGILLNGQLQIAARLLRALPPQAAQLLLTMI